MTELLRITILALNLVLMLYGIYFAWITLGTLARCKSHPAAPPAHRFALVIAARNEELVIGNLIDSLKNQNYPKELYEVYVIPNNCTDGTREVAASRGALIFDGSSKIRSKGDALREFFGHQLATQATQASQASKASKADYDAYCIFDADNVASPQFLAEMNNAMAAGVKIAQGCHDSKNPYDTFMSGCYTIYYLVANRIYNQSRKAIGLSALICGSGFLISADTLKKLGGWNTVTITEDTELTAQCALIGEKVHYVKEAVVYDEQIQSFGLSWKQRLRWSTGSYQVLWTYGKKLLVPSEKKNLMDRLDLFLFLIAPPLQVVYLVLFALLASLGAFDFILGLLIFSYLTCTGIALAVLLLEGKKLRRMWKGIFSFWILIMSWIPINAICLFRKQTVWHPIQHNRTIRIEEIEPNS